MPSERRTTTDAVHDALRAPLVGLLLLLSPLVGAGAAADASSGGWAIASMSFDGSASIFVETAAKESHARGIIVLDADRRTLTSVFGPHDFRDVDVWVEEERTGLAEAYAVRLGVASPSSVGAVVSGPPAQIYVIAFAAGTLESWRYVIDGSPHTEIARGEETFYSDGRGFTGGADVTAQLWGVRISQVQDRVFPLEIDGNFVGRIGRPSGAGAQVGEITLHGDAGPRPCPCRISSVVGPTAVAPGAYEARRNTIEIDADPSDHILYGADVRFPSS